MLSSEMKILNVTNVTTANMQQNKNNNDTNSSPQGYNGVGGGHNHNSPKVKYSNCNTNIKSGSNSVLSNITVSTNGRPKPTPSHQRTQKFNNNNNNTGNNNTNHKYHKKHHHHNKQPHQSHQQQQYYDIPIATSTQNRKKFFNHYNSTVSRNKAGHNFSHHNSPNNKYVEYRNIVAPSPSNPVDLLFNAAAAATGSHSLHPDSDNNNNTTHKNANDECKTLHSTETTVATCCFSANDKNNSTFSPDSETAASNGNFDFIKPPPLQSAHKRSSRNCWHPVPPVDSAVKSPAATDLSTIISKSTKKSSSDSSKASTTTTNSHSALSSTNSSCSLAGKSDDLPRDLGIVKNRHHNNNSGRNKKTHWKTISVASNNTSCNSIYQSTQSTESTTPSSRCTLHQEQPQQQLLAKSNSLQLEATASGRAWEAISKGVTVLGSKNIENSSPKFSADKNTKLFAEGPGANKIAMTTALAADTVSTTTTSTAPSDAASSTATSISSDVTTPAKTSSAPATDVGQTLSSPSTTSLSSSAKNAIAIPEIKEPSPASASKSSARTGSTTSLNTSPALPRAGTSSSGPSSPNSYSLDFLHSVGVKMTGGAKLAVPKTSMANMRSSATCSNHSGSASPARNGYSFPNMVERPHSTHRFGNGGNSGPGGNNGGGVGVSNQQHGHIYNQKHHHYQHYHHHQPQQLTIASFMQKDLLNENFVGNRPNNSTSGGFAASSVCNNNDYVNRQAYHQQQRYHNYYQPHYQLSPQQQSPSPKQNDYAALQHPYHSLYAGEGVSRIVDGDDNVSSENATNQRQHFYQKYQNNSGNNVNAVPQTRPRQQQHHRESSNSGHNRSNNSTSDLQHLRQSQHLMPAKKSHYTSSSGSSGSSSSSSSVSSISSKTSLTSYSQQKGKSATHLAIETIPHRSSHRPQHDHHHNSNNNNSNHIQQNHYNMQHVSIGQTPSTPQLFHQNIFNLTYVNTDSNIASAPPPSVAPVSAATTSRGCSPLPATSGTPSPQPLNTLMSLNYDARNNYYQNVVKNKIIPPLSLAACTPTSSPVPDAASLSNNNRTNNMGAIEAIYAPLVDESTQPTTPTPSAATSSGDFEDSDASSTHSSILSRGQIEHKYQPLKSAPLSTSSSASSTSSATCEQSFVPLPSSEIGPSMMKLHSPNPNAPMQFAYNQRYQGGQQPHVPSPQPSQNQQNQYRGNDAMSLLELPLNNNNYSDDDLKVLKQQSVAAAQRMQQQQAVQHFYYAPGDHLNASPLPTGLGNGGYWSPLRHSCFLYSQAVAATNMLPAPSCSTATATITTLSPRIAEQQQHHGSSSPCHTTATASEQQQFPPLNHLKRSPSQTMCPTSLAQLPHSSRLPPQPSTPGSTGTSATTVTSLRARTRNQPQTQTHHQQMSAPAAPPPLPYPYQQHSILHGCTQPHMRPSTPSSHDFFAHTPPDRFLARAHLVEAKETPASLLNNSKWDNLSQGIWNKFISSQQTEETFKQKMRLWRYLYIIIKNAYPRYGLYLVGSTISGFGADTSDVDMCLVSRSTSSIDPRMEALFNLTILRDCLAKSVEFENFNLIEAKVPILRFRDRIHQLEVDLNFNNCVGIKNTHLLYCYSQLDWRLRPLVLITKLWAQYHNINNAKDMTISSYSLVLMVIHFLQYAVSPAVLPCLHDMFPEKFPLLRSNDFGYVDMTETIGPYESKNSQTLGELFLYFLEYYSCFDYTQFAISIRTGGLLPINVCRQAKSQKNDVHQWKELCIEEPFDLTNTARSVYDYETFERVKAVFVASWRILQETLDLNSIFTPIMIPPTSSVSQSGLLNANTVAAQQQEQQQHYEDIGTTATAVDTSSKHQTATMNIPPTLNAEVNAVSNTTSTSIPTTTFRYIIISTI